MLGRISWAPPARRSRGTRRYRKRRRSGTRSMARPAPESEILLVQIDPNPPARTEVFTGSGHRSPSRLQARVTGKNLCWENVNNLMDLARVNLQRSVARN